jgi:hypothetical protein
MATIRIPSMACLSFCAAPPPAATRVSLQAKTWCTKPALENGFAGLPGPGMSIATAAFRIPVVSPP